MPTTTLPPIHPGEISKEEFMEPFGLTMNALARELHVAPNRISQIVNAQSVLTADTALRLSAFFGTTPEFWMNLQTLHDLELARAKSASQITKQILRWKTGDDLARSKAITR